MEEDGERRVRAKRSDESDWINELPDPILCQVLSNLPTKDAVKTSVLSSRWRNLWKQVPVLDLDNNADFTEYNTFVNFVDTFLDQSPYLDKFKLKYDCDGGDYEPEIGLIWRWINTLVTTRKIKHIDVLDDSNDSWDLEMSPNLYICESLVSLKLCALTLPSPEFVSLPSLKVLDLTIVKFGDDVSALERLISHCPVLESLVIERSFCDDIEVLRVRSQSLLRFTHVVDGDDVDEDLVVDIDAPRLESMRLCDARTATFILNNPNSLVEVVIDTVFNISDTEKFNPDDVQKRSMIRNFLLGISGVKDMVIASSTLEVFYDYSRCEPLPLFRNLSSLHVIFVDYRWEMSPTFLERCPKLKSLVVGATRCRERARTDIPSGPRCSLESLEYVKVERPLKGEVMEMNLVAYLLQNSTILKKVTLCLDDSRKNEESTILKELLTFPRISKSCQVVVL